MSLQKPKLVLRQIYFIICLLLALLVNALTFAKSEGRLDLIHPDLAGENPLASIKIDSVDASTPGQMVEIPILIQNSVVFGGFELEVDFCYLNLTFYGADRGEALPDDWEYFSYRVLPYTDTLYRLLFYGQHDIPDGHQGVPLAPNPDYVSLVVMSFQSTGQNVPPGTLFPIVFEWESDDCAENTFADSSGDTLYVSQDSVQYDTNYCPHGSHILPSLEFSDGGLYAFYPSILRGDINLNYITYEVADFLLLVDFLDQGPDVFWDPERQYPASDINADGINVTIADLVYMDRVIMQDAPPFPISFGSDYLESDNQTDRMALGAASANPGEAVSIPLFFGNTLPASGISCKIVFDSTLLSIQNVETIETRLENWTQVHTIAKPGALFLHAMPNYLGEPPQEQALPAEFGILVEINFLMSDLAPEGIMIPLEFQNDPYWQLYWGHYNAYTQDGIDFIQPTTFSGSIFTDVIPGDANSDGVIDVADIICLINYLFIYGSPPNPLSLGDFNQDGEVNIADIVALINYLYLS